MPLYSDINSLTPRTKPLLKDVEAIYQSLFNILLTSKGEVPYNPEDGINLEDELFELMDSTSALSIFGKVMNAIEANEPRVEIDFSRTRVEPIPNSNEFGLLLSFDIPGFDLQNLKLTHRFARTS